jgi:hypothetical protein
MGEVERYIRTGILGTVLPKMLSSLDNMSIADIE